MANFSCYVTILNQSSYPMIRTDFTAVDGHFTQMPPLSIPAGGNGECVIQDPAGAAIGSEGHVTYQITDKTGTTGAIQFSFTDPYDGDNAVSGQWVTSTHPDVDWSFSAKTDGGTWQDNKVDDDGHPVYARFIVSND